MPQVLFLFARGAAFFVAFVLAYISKVVVGLPIAVIRYVLHRLAESARLRVLLGLMVAAIIAAVVAGLTETKYLHTLLLE
jgi:hypothetical protein